MSFQDNQNPATMQNQNLISNKESKIRYELSNSGASSIGVAPSSSSPGPLPQKERLPSISELFRPNSQRIIEPFQPINYTYSQPSRSTPFDPPRYSSGSHLFQPFASFSNSQQYNGLLQSSSHSPISSNNWNQTDGYSSDNVPPKPRSVSPGFESSEDEATQKEDSNDVTDYSYLDTINYLSKLIKSVENGMKASTTIDACLQVLSKDIKNALKDGSALDCINQEQIKNLLRNLENTKDSFKHMHEHRDELIRQRAAGEPFASSGSSSSALSTLKPEKNFKSPEGDSSGETTSEAGTSSGNLSPFTGDPSNSPYKYSDDSSPTLSGPKLKKPKNGRHKAVNTPGQKCQQCYNDETPEWRRGPYGSRSLCNACGLFYTKLTRKYNRDLARAVMDKRRQDGCHDDRRIPNLSAHDLNKTLA